MADLSFHHGTRVFENADTPVLIRTAQSAVIHLSGTAPEATSDLPIDRAKLLKGASGYPALSKIIGRTGTLRNAIDAIFDQGGTSKLGAYIYVHRFAEGASPNETFSNLVGDRAAMTGVYSVRKIPTFGVNEHYKPRIFIAPGFTAPLATDGIASVSMAQRGSGYTTATAAVTDATGHGCVLATSLDANGAVTVIVQKPGWGYTDPVVTITGDGVGAQAAAHVGAVGNPVAHEFSGLCGQMRAVGFIDGPSTTDEAAVLAREQYGSDYLYMCDPQLQGWDTAVNAYVPQPPSARFAGVQCRLDRDIGFHKSVSNALINGVDGPVRPIQYGEQTDYLNENLVGTVIHRNGGWYTWGNRVTSGKFLAVVRTRMFINEAIENAYMDYVDRVMNDANLKLLVEDGKRFLRTLEGEGPVMRSSSELWYDPAKNFASEMKQGRITLSIRYETPPPIEDIRIEAYDNIQAYDLLLDRVRGAVEVGPLSLAA